METQDPTRQRRVLRRYSAEDRKRLIQEHKTSGMTRKAFCEQHGIHPTTFSGWLKRAEKHSARFAELSVPVRSDAPIEVDLPNGAVIKVRTTGDLARTAELIRRVTGAGAC